MLCLVHCASRPIQIKSCVITACSKVGGEEQLCRQVSWVSSIKVSSPACGMGLFISQPVKSPTAKVLDGMAPGSWKPKVVRLGDRYMLSSVNGFCFHVMDIFWN